MEDIENLIEELTKVRPEMLNEEALNLFNTIMAVLDERDKLKKENRELKESCKTCVVRNNLDDYVENSISKSKIVEIYREIEKKTRNLFNSTYIPMNERIYNDNRERYEPMLKGREIAIECLKSLQELMEDK